VLVERAGEDGAHAEGERAVTQQLPAHEQHPPPLGCWLKTESWLKTEAGTWSDFVSISSIMALTV
jgi:hypothetical protein